MWQTPNSKPGGAGSGKRSTRAQTRNTYHLKRVTAEIRSGQNAGAVRIMLNDLSAKGVGAYCNCPFVAGQDVSLMIAVPTAIYLRGKISYCREQEADSHVISSVPFTYRIGIKFVFENAAEEAAAIKYCEDIIKSLKIKHAA